MSYSGSTGELVSRILFDSSWCRRIWWEKTLVRTFCRHETSSDKRYLVIRMPVQDYCSSCEYSVVFPPRWKCHSHSLLIHLKEQEGHCATLGIQMENVICSLNTLYFVEWRRRVSLVTNNRHRVRTKRRRNEWRSKANTFVYRMVTKVCKTTRVMFFSRLDLLMFFQMTVSWQDSLRDYSVHQESHESCYFFSESRDTCIVSLSFARCIDHCSGWVQYLFSSFILSSLSSTNFPCSSWNPNDMKDVKNVFEDSCFSIKNSFIFEETYKQLKAFQTTSLRCLSFVKNNMDNIWEVCIIAKEFSYSRAVVIRGSFWQIIHTFLRKRMTDIINKRRTSVVVHSFPKYIYNFDS